MVFVCPGFGDGVKGYGIQFKPKDGTGPEVTHVSALARTHAERERERERASERESDGSDLKVFWYLEYH